MKIVNIVKVQQWNEFYEAYEEYSLKLLATKKLTERGVKNILAREYSKDNLKGLEILSIESMVLS
jgi:hypothetical protein